MVRRFLSLFQTGLRRIWSNRPKRYFLLFALLTLPIVWYNTDWIWYRAGVLFLLLYVIALWESWSFWKEEILPHLDFNYPVGLSLYLLQMRSPTVNETVASIRLFFAFFLFFFGWDWGPLWIFGVVLWERLLLWLFFFYAQFLLLLYGVEPATSPRRGVDSPLLLFRSSQPEEAPVNLREAAKTVQQILKTGTQESILYMKQNPIKVVAAVGAGGVMTAKYGLDKLSDHFSQKQLLIFQSELSLKTAKSVADVDLYKAKGLADIDLSKQKESASIELSKLNRQIELADRQILAADKQSAVIDKRIELVKLSKSAGSMNDPD